VEFYQNLLSLLLKVHRLFCVRRRCMDSLSLLLDALPDAYDRRIASMEPE
jgi:hypothetical protein